MDKITKKLSNNKKLFVEFETYFNKFSSIVGSYYEDDMKTLKKFMKKFDELLKQVKKIKIRTSKDFDNYFSIIHHLAHLDMLTMKIKRKFVYFNPGKHRFTQEFSTTYILDTSAMFDRVIILINNILKKHERYDAEIIEFLGIKIMDQFEFGDVLKSQESLRQTYHKYRNSISLYAYVSQMVLDTLFKGEKHQRKDAFKIMAILEADKNFELSQGQLEKTYTGKEHNPPVQSFGLIPKTSFKPLNEIIQIAFNQSVSGSPKESVFEEIGKTNNLTIIVHKKITQRPTEYSLTKLFEKSSEKHTTGIKDELLKKFTTINSNKKYATYKFQIDVYGEPLDSPSQFITIETVNTNRYRILSPWVSFSFLVNKHDASDYIGYVKNKVIKKPTRSENYNNIMISKMVDNMFLERSVNVKKMSVESQVNEIKFLRNAVYTSLLRHYVDVMDKDYDNGKNIKSNKDLIKIINDDKVKDLFQEILVKNYYAFLKKNNFLEDNTSFVFTEVLSTFLATLQIITRGFIREIYSNSEKFEPPESLYKKSYPVMYAEIRDVFDKVLKTSLTKTMDDKSNIYQSLMYKTMIIDL